MRNIKKIFIVVFSLILLFAVSCDTESKTGSGGGTGTGGNSGIVTPPSGDGDSGTEPPQSEPETTEPIDAKDFPTELLGTYEHYNVSSKNGDGKRSN